MFFSPAPPPSLYAMSNLLFLQVWVGGGGEWGSSIGSYSSPWDFIKEETALRILTTLPTYFTSWGLVHVCSCDSLTFTIHLFNSRVKADIKEKNFVHRQPLEEYSGVFHVLLTSIWQKPDKNVKLTQIIFFRHTPLQGHHNYHEEESNGGNCWFHETF